MLIGPFGINLEMVKRFLDIIVAIILMLLLLPLLAVVSLLILTFDGRPVFHLSERMKTFETGFVLWKFRTMSVEDDDMRATGAHKNSRITKIGKILRKSRLDEIPQLWNVFVGDMSFVGPRPPLRRYVEKFPTLYYEILRNKPGVTGLASVHFHKHEEWLLKNSADPEQSEKIYCERCVPRKAKLDMLYQQNQNLCLDIKIIVLTLIKQWR